MDKTTALALAERIMDEVLLLEESGIPRDLIKKVVARLVEKETQSDSFSRRTAPAEGVSDLIWEGEK